MKWRKRTSQPAEDEFLRALEARRAPAGEDVPQDHEDRSSGGEMASVPGGGDADGALAPALSEAEERAAGAEAALVQVRDEAERRVADARAGIEREREQRAAAERGLEQAQAELARQRAEFEERERELSEQLNRRPAASEEGEERERWERWEADAQREAERRAAELAEAERRIAGARAALDAARDASGASATPAAPAPAVRSERRGGVRRLLGRRRKQPTACATCARAFPRNGAEGAAAGWDFGLRGGAICPECQAQGWHFPDGSLVPVRRASITSP